jgi:hypothetical protein
MNSSKPKQIGTGMVNQIKIWPLILVAMTVFIFIISVSVTNAEEEGEFEVAEIYFELNDTDGDLGIHALIDGDEWKRLEIEDPNERELLNILVRGSLLRQGLTEIFFESAEPTFDELAPEKFFRRFPEGIYEIEGKTLEGDDLGSEVQVSHVMPAPPDVWIKNNPAAEDCDAEDLPEFKVGKSILLSWDPVTESHPDLGETGEVVVKNYEVVVEIDDTPWKTSIILPPDMTSFLIPDEILAMAELDADGEAEIKFEVLVRAENNNQTAVESCFVIFEK